MHLGGTILLNTVQYRASSILRILRFLSQWDGMHGGQSRSLGQGKNAGTFLKGLEGLRKTRKASPERK
jgi:hypothetical protein